MVDPVRGPVAEVMERRFFVDEAYEAVFVTFGTRVARALTWFDARIVDGAVMGSGAVSMATGRLARRAQSGMVRSYVAVMLVVLAVLLAVTVGLVR
jgi:NADH-quinone oxidoreductase subunit L